MTDIRETAAHWVVRLQDPEIGDADLVAFDAWLSVSEGHQQAYDRALEVWLDLDRAAGEAAEPEKMDVIARPTRPYAQRPTIRPAVWASGAALAAGLLAMVAIVSPLQTTQTPEKAARPLVYATAHGERRTVTLADGSRIELNAATRLEVQLGGAVRKVTLKEGEAAFEVKHDAARPFVVATGDGMVRDLGTEFDVRQRDEAFSVTVRRGSIRFEPAGGLGGPALQLSPGQRLERVAGASTPAVHRVTADDDFGWRRDQLVLRSQPLASVVAELNLHFSKPIRIVDPDLAKRPVSGVLRLDDEPATLRRLALFAPLKATARNGVVMLEAAEAARP